MGCSSCGGARAAAAATYPKEVVLPDGSTATVTSVADERIQRQNAQARMRAQASERGYSVRRN